MKLQFGIHVICVFCLSHVANVRTVAAIIALQMGLINQFLNISLIKA